MFRRAAYSILAFALAVVAAHADPIITGAIPNTFTPGSTISSSQMNANFQYIINQANANAAKNGANSSITALTGLTTPIVPAEGGSNIFIGGISTGTANAQVVATAVPSGYTLAYGNTVRFIAGFTNTGATTLAANGTAVTNIYKQTPLGLVPLVGGEIVVNATIEAFYDGTQYELLQSSSADGGFGPLTVLAGAATTDLGTINSHNISITGAPTTITSFGSSANTAYPIYWVQFSAAHTLTGSASLNLLGSLPYRTTAAPDRGLYLYNGAGVWYELAYFPAQPKYAPTMANALFIRNNPVTPTTKIDVSAKEIVLDSSTGANQYVDSYYGGGTCTIDFGVVGSGGLDAGVIAANTWYYIYATGDGTTGTNCIASTSATTPTLPAGTPYKARLGAIRTATASAVLWTFTQRGRRTALIAAATSDSVIASGISGTCSATLTATGNVFGAIVPSTAADVNVLLSAGAPGATCVAPSGGALSLGEVCAQGGAATLLNVPATINYNGTNTLLYCGTTASSLLSAVGWDDAVNAN